MKTFKTLLVAAVAGGIAVASNAAHAQTIIQDNFDDYSPGGNGDLSGTSPDTDLPGTTWSAGNGASENSTTSYALSGSGSTSNVALLNPANSAGASIGLGSYATTNLPASLTLSAYIGSPTGGSPSYVGLGFGSSSITGSGAISNGFEFLGGTGGNGSLLEFINGGQVGSAVAFGGTYNYNELYLLSFTVNTSTGAITNISLQGSTANYNSLLGTAAFQGANLDFLQMAGANNGGAFYSDLTLSEPGSAPVPEPTTIALMLGGLGFVALLQRRRFNSLR